MSKIFAILSILFCSVFTGCDFPDAIPSKNTEKRIGMSWDYSTIQELTYDGCQYIYIPLGDATWGTHKGNCNNPIHVYNKEKSE